VMTGVSKTLLEQSNVPQMQHIFQAWSDFLYDQSGFTNQPLNRLPTANWSVGTGQFSMRSGWSTDAAYANLICGPYSESHAHRDQGSFVFFKGSWLAYDGNIDSRNGLAQEESVHNLVRVENNGAVVGQTLYSSCNMAALADNEVYSYGLADLTPSYSGKAAVSKMQREFLLIKPATLVILDRVNTNGAKRVWTLNLPNTPTVSGDNLTAKNGNNELNMVRLAPTGLTSQVLSSAAVNSNMKAGTRVDVVDSNGNSSVFLNVLGADHSFTKAERSDASGQTGAKINLANGNVATVRFSTNGTGGSLEIRDPSGNVVSNGPLPTNVQAPPRFVN
jgi:hypothetical protein